MGTSTVVLDRVYDDDDASRWPRFLAVVEKGRVVMSEVALWPMLVVAFEEEDKEAWYGPEAPQFDPLLGARLVLRHGAFEFASVNQLASGDSREDQANALRAVAGGLAAEGLTGGGGRLQHLSSTATKLSVVLSSGFCFEIRPRVPDDAWSIAIED